MGAARGIAGSLGPEVEGCFLSADEFDADWFIQMNNTGGEVDLWAVDDIDPLALVESSNGFNYYPGRIPCEQVTLLRADIPAVPQQQPEASSAYDSDLRITFDADTEGWSFTVRSISPTRYEAIGNHANRTTVRTVSGDLDSALAQCRQAAAGRVT